MQQTKVTTEINKVLNKVICNYYRLDDRDLYEQAPLVELSNVRFESNHTKCHLQMRFIPHATAALDLDFRFPFNEKMSNHPLDVKGLYTCLVPILFDMSLHCINEANNRVNKGFDDDDDDDLVAETAARSYAVLRALTTRKNQNRYMIDEAKSESNFIDLLLASSKAVQALTHAGEIVNGETDDNDGEGTYDLNADNINHYLDVLPVGFSRMLDVADDVDVTFSGNDRYAYRVLSRAIDDRFDVRDSGILPLLTVLEAYWVVKGDYKIWQKLISTKEKVYLSSDEINQIMGDTVVMLAYSEPARLKVALEYDVVLGDGEETDVDEDDGDE